MCPKVENRYRGRPASGFTLIELMVAMVILAILIAAAMPSFREIGLNNRSSGTINSLLADLATARSEAVKTARPAYVTANGGNWTSGWVIWVDANGNGSQDADEPVLRRQTPINGSVTAADNMFTIRALSGATTGGVAVTQMGFGARGQAIAPATGARFALCRPDGNAARSTGIQVAVSGRAQSAKGLSSLNLGCS